MTSAEQGATGEPILRRSPRQVRGQRRIEAILDAAEALFAEVGYEAATTNAIAARAQTSIGSLYQFFPNKEAILRALALRFLDQLRALLDTALADAEALADLTRDDLLDQLIDPLVAAYATRAGMLRIFLAMGGLGELATTPRVLTEEIAARLDALVARREPRIPAEKRRLHALVLMQTVRALLPLTVAPDGATRPEMISELKRLLRAYIDSVLAEYPLGDLV
jgi:AcrR family transcriptional regulator